MEQYKEGQHPLVYLVSSAEAVASAALGFVFTDGHPLPVFTAFFNALTDLASIDWGVMPLTYWNNTPQDPDRKRRRQAEFLVHGSCAWELVEAIATYDDEQAAVARQATADLSHRPAILVRRHWYY